MDVLVVGGAGRMGRRLAAFFRSRGLSVAISDPAGGVRGFRSASLDEAGSARNVAVAASLARSREALEEVLDRRPAGLVFDIASVKAPLLPALERARRDGVAIASVHPMFGPEVASFRGERLVVCDAGDARAVRAVRRLFAGAGLLVRVLPLAEHDPLVARTLGLAQLAALASARALAGLGVEPRRVAGLESTSFRRLLDLATSIAGQDPALSFAIQAENPDARAAAAELAREAARLARFVETKDAAGFAAWLAPARAALGLG